MNIAQPSADQVRALLNVAWDDKGEERAIAVFHQLPWNGGETLAIPRVAFRVRPCESVLEVREALLESEEGEPVVILTPLSESVLGGDVVARLARRRVLPLDPWRIVMDLFKARLVDPRLASESWLPEVLMESRPSEGWPVLPNGVLDADTVRALLLRQRLGFESGRPDVQELLSWSSQQGRAGVWRSQPEPFRRAVRAWLAETAGHAAPAILGCLESEPSTDILALGIACGVVFAPEAAGSIRLERAAVRLERFTGGQRVSPEAGRAWAGAAEAVVRRLIASHGLGGVRPTLETADMQLGQLEALEEAGGSRVALSGFETRMRAAAAALSAGLTGVVAASGELEGVLDRVKDHELAGAFSERVERLDMAVRLLRWLKMAATVPQSFEEAMRTYSGDASFADRARYALSVTEPCRELADSYSRLVTESAERREAFNERFGGLLRDWLAAGAQPGSLVLIEEVLSRIVSPVAASRPVLLLVFDGMSQWVWKEVLSHLVRDGWCELAPDDAPSTPPIVASLPTITEVCRTSLLCGQLRRGAAADEKAGFEAHPDLLQRTTRKAPPILFHKGDLGEDASGVSSRVQAEVASKERHIVGVVLNAVDDYLLKGDQIEPRWTLDFIRPLRTLLHAAREARRVLVITADHGHIPERGLEVRASEEGERWRSDDGSAQAGEVHLAGPRVLAPGNRLLAPWSERLRYGAKKNGYHGGASPQEVVVPLGVLTPGEPVAGWHEVPSVLPGWWEVSGAAPLAVSTPPVAPAQVAAKPAKVQRQLFVEDPPQPQSAVPAGVQWIDALLESDVFSVQLSAAGRAVRDKSDVRRFLDALETGGGTLTAAGLCQRLAIPLARLRPQVAAMGRVLNVDGFQIVFFDDTSESIHLNRDLLRRQFAIS